jgi:hypothetical protein
MRAGLALLALIVIYQAIKTQMNGTGFLIFAIVCILIMFPLFAVGKFAKNADERDDQRARDKAIQAEADRLDAALEYSHEISDSEILLRNKSSRVKKISKHRILYLRPFFADDSLKLQNPRKENIYASFVPFYRLIQPDLLAFDDAIRIVISRHGEMVAIGAPSEIVGAAKIRVGDDQWKAHFWAMSHAARSIIMFPAPRPGTMWELNEISCDNSLREKTIFLLPFSATTIESDIPGLKTVKLLLRNVGLSVPDEVSMGDGVVFNRDGAAVCREKVIKSGVMGHWIDAGALRRCLKATRITSV